MYKDLDVLRSPTIKNSVYFVYSSATQKVTQIWVTTNQNVPKQVELSAPITLKTVTSPNGTIEVVETPTEIQLELESSLLAQINSALQAGDNISELVNDANYITIGDVPVFNPSDYDLDEFNNNGADPYAHQSEITSGVTNLSYTASPTQGTVNSDTGADSVIPLADLTNAGLLSPTEKVDISTALQNGDNGK
jgi:hypothetical protein